MVGAHPGCAQGARHRCLRYVETGRPETFGSCSGALNIACSPSSCLLVCQSFGSALLLAAPGALWWRSGQQRPAPLAPTRPACSKYGGWKCGLSPLATERCCSAPIILQPNLTTYQERLSTRLFFSAVSPRLMCGAFGSAQKLASAVAEARKKSGACVRALSAFARVCRRFKPALAQRGVQALILVRLLRLSVCK